jgi:hypothetical protein
MRMQAYEVKWYEYFYFMETAGMKQGIMDYAIKNSEISEGLQDY